jgi:2-dehydro-3-deoxyphosphooctonate aldolase (KDO 8-P synthase)
MHPEGMRGAVEKIRAARPAGFSASALADEAVTERGTFLGYGDLVVDMRNFAVMREATGAPVIFDGTHSVQQPGRGSGGASGGLRGSIPSLVLAAVAAGADGLFLETHPDPERAPSDGATMLPLDQLERLLRRAAAVWRAATG